ncbi:MAG: hypothetical protein OEV94_10550 [Deltaproteobacteria bacterium]|nr:hypothetical protein [Deltaproteobacteria bacterium]
MNCTLYTNHGKVFCDMPETSETTNTSRLVEKISHDTFQVKTIFPLSQGEGDVLMLDAMETHLPVRVEKCEPTETGYRVMLRSEGLASHGLLSA